MTSTFIGVNYKNAVKVYGDPGYEVTTSIWDWGIRFNRETGCVWSDKTNLNFHCDGVMR